MFLFLVVFFVFFLYVFWLSTWAKTHETTTVVLWPSCSFPTELYLNWFGCWWFFDQATARWWAKLPSVPRREQNFWTNNWKNQKNLKTHRNNPYSPTGLIWQSWFPGNEAESEDGQVIDFGRKKKSAMGNFDCSQRTHQTMRKIERYVSLSVSHENWFLLGNFKPIQALLASRTRALARDILYRGAGVGTIRWRLEKTTLFLTSLAYGSLKWWQAVVGCSFNSF